MNYADYHHAKLETDALNALQDLEQELGKTLVAFTKDDKPASLSEEQVARIQSLEECLGATVVAY
jgi:hypothetical protein